MSPAGAVSPVRVAVLAPSGLAPGSEAARRVASSAGALRRAIPDATLTLVARDAWAEDVARGLGVAFVPLARGGALARLLPGRSAAALRAALAAAGADVVHAHGAAAAAAARAALGGASARVVVDVAEDHAASRRLERGVGDDPSTPPDPEEARAVRDAGAALYATRALAARLPPGPDAPRAVVPATVDDASALSDEDAERERETRRATLGLVGPERVVAWTDAASAPGAASGELPRLAGILAHAFERVPQMRALLVVADPPAARAALERVGIGAGRAVVVAPPAGSLVRALLVADAAVLLRRPAMANALASPLAFPDALAAGLQVVVSAALPEVADVVQRTPVLGHVLTWRSEDAVWAARLAGAARPQDAEARAARRAFARERHSPEAAAAGTRSVYAALSRLPGADRRGPARAG